MRDKELTLEITEQCDMNCSWCSTNATPNGKHVPLQRIKSQLRTLQSMCNVVRLSGGEPLLHPDFREIVREAKYLDYKVVLLTNGQRTSGISIRDEFDEVVVSVINNESFLSARWYALGESRTSLHIVSVAGEESRIVDAITFAYEQNIPIHVLALQKQGRGKNCQPSKLFTWTGMVGCNAVNKITINVKGEQFTCSAFKNRRCDL